MGSLGSGAKDGRFSGFGRLSGFRCGGSWVLWVWVRRMVGSPDFGVLFWVRNGEDGFGGTKSRGCR